MTRTGSSKPVDRSAAPGRLKKGQAYHRAAQILVEHIEEFGDSDPVRSCLVLAAIAYADAVTIAYLGLVNQKDHNALGKLLRDAVGNQLPEAQQKQLARLLKSKDEVQYGTGFGRPDGAIAALEELDRFSEWALAILKKRSVAG